ncbi:MAG: hypothetical protein SPK71_03355, partial [Prevotella sp.]|nr:hypothetical protein [Prevotella sp.]
QPNDHPLAGGLLHTPSHPYPMQQHMVSPSLGRSFSSAFTHCRQQLPFSEVELPALPGLSSRDAKCRQRQNETLRSDPAKVHKKL